MRFVIALGLALLLPAAARAQPQSDLLVYAAASLTDALGEIGEAYRKETGQTAKFSFASSAILARQLEAGANADVYVSADAQWMDYVEAHHLIRPQTRVDLLTNRLVLVAPADSAVRLDIAPGFDLARALGKGRLAIGDPESVPAGRYARAALMWLGVWPSVSDRLVTADNVRSALAFVGRGEAPLGVVYATDAQVERGVRIVATFPPQSHPPIVYPLAATVHARNGAERFIAFACSDAGRGVFEHYGFGVLSVQSTQKGSTP